METFSLSEIISRSFVDESCRNLDDMCQDIENFGTWTVLSRECALENEPQEREVLANIMKDGDNVES